MLYQCEEYELFLLNAASQRVTEVSVVKNEFYNNNNDNDYEKKKMTQWCETVAVAVVS